MPTPASAPDWPNWLARSDVPTQDKVARLAEYVATQGKLPAGCDFLWSETSKLLASGRSSAAVLPQLFTRLTPKQLAMLVRAAPETNTRTLFAGLIAGSLQEASLKPVLSAFVRVLDEEQLGALLRSLGQLAGLYPADEPMMGQRLLAMLRKLPQDPARFSQHLAALRVGARWLPQGDDRVRAWRQFYETFERFVHVCRQKAGLLTAVGQRSEREDVSQQLVAELAQAMPKEWYADDQQGTRKRQLVSGLIAAAKLSPESLPKDFEQKVAGYFQTGKWAVPPPLPKPQPPASPVPGTPTTGTAGSGTPATVTSTPATVTSTPATGTGTPATLGATPGVSAIGWKILAGMCGLAVLVLIGVLAFHAIFDHSRQTAQNPASDEAGGAPSGPPQPPLDSAPKPPERTPERAQGPTEPKTSGVGPSQAPNSTPAPPAKGKPSEAAPGSKPPPAATGTSKPPPKTIEEFPVAELPTESIDLSFDRTGPWKLAQVENGLTDFALHLHGCEQLNCTFRSPTGDSGKFIDARGDKPTVKAREKGLDITALRETGRRAKIAAIDVANDGSIELKVISPGNPGFRAVQRLLRFCVLEIRDNETGVAQYIALQKPRQVAEGFKFDPPDLAKMRREAALKLEPSDAPPGEKKFCLGSGRLNLPDGESPFGVGAPTQSPSDIWPLADFMQKKGLSGFGPAVLKSVNIVCSQGGAESLVLAVETEPEFVPDPKVKEVCDKLARLDEWKERIPDLSAVKERAKSLKPSKPMSEPEKEVAAYMMFLEEQGRTTPDQKLKWAQEAAAVLGKTLPDSDPTKGPFATWVVRGLHRGAVDARRTSLQTELDKLGDWEKGNLQRSLKMALESLTSVNADVYRVVEVPNPKEAGKAVPVRVLVISRS